MNPAVTDANANSAAATEVHVESLIGFTRDFQPEPLGSLEIFLKGTELEATFHCIGVLCSALP